MLLGVLNECGSDDLLPSCLGRSCSCWLWVVCVSVCETWFSKTGLVCLKTWLPAVVLVGGRFDCVREDQVPYEMVTV